MLLLFLAPFDDLTWLGSPSSDEKEAQLLVPPACGISHYRLRDRSRGECPLLDITKCILSYHPPSLGICGSHPSRLHVQSHPVFLASICLSTSRHLSGPCFGTTVVSRPQLSRPNTECLLSIRINLQTSHDLGPPPSPRPYYSIICFPFVVSGSSHKLRAQSLSRN